MLLVEICVGEDVDRAASLKALLWGIKGDGLLRLLQHNSSWRAVGADTGEGPVCGAPTIPPKGMVLESTGNGGRDGQWHKVESELSEDVMRKRSEVRSVLTHGGSSNHTPSSAAAAARAAA